MVGWCEVWWGLGLSQARMLGAFRSGSVVLGAVCFAMVRIINGD